VDELRGEIARLNDRLARAEERLSRLEITRETVAEILGGGGRGPAGNGDVDKAHAQRFDLAAFGGHRSTIAAQVYDGGDA